MVHSSVSINYPLSWVALPQTYQTPVEQAEGKAPEVIAVVFAPKSEISGDGSIKLNSNNYVQVGARQEICSDFEHMPRPSSTFRCASAIKGLGFDLDPILTNSTNEDVLDFYASLLSQLRNSGWTVTTY